MMRIKLTIPGEPTAETLGIALEAATRLAQHDVREGRVPDLEQAISEGLHWQPEPPGDESFDPPVVSYERGNADCDDLAPWLAAEMREKGYDDGAESFAVRSGPRTWHALVRGSDGTVYDPSRWAGMPYDVVGQCMPVVRPLSVGRPGIVVGQRSVRVDMPGLQARRGCEIGTAHECACDATDEDRVHALIHTIEDAIATAQLARTGDARALKALAVIYRVLRGDDPDHACEGLNIHREHVGMDFDAPHVRKFIQSAREILAAAADEIFNGDTWTAHGDRIVKARKIAVSGRGHGQHRVGILPCLLGLAPIAEAAITAGTIAAVAQPLAKWLEDQVGANTDFGKVLHGLQDVLGDVKLVSALGSGLDALITAGTIPEAVEAAAARWYETLRSPLDAAGISGTKTQDVSKALAWTENALAKSLPPDIATHLTPQLLDQIIPYARLAGTPLGAFMAAQVGEQIHTLLFDKMKELHLGQGIPEAIAGYLAEKDAANALLSLSHSDAPPPVPGSPPIPEDLLRQFREGTPEPAPQPASTPQQPTSEYGGVTAVVTPGEVAEAETVREHLRTVPINATVPAGWDPIFALGCRQATGQCPT